MTYQTIEVTTTRANHLIDPSLAIWGMEIPIYLFLGGVVAGIMVLLAAMELQRGERPRSAGVRAMPLVAIGLLTVGMVALFLDLELQHHAFRFYLAFRPSSPMSWGSWILLLVYPSLLLLGLGALSEQQRVAMETWKVVRWLRLGGLLDGAFALADRHRRAVLLASLIGGVALGAYTGLLLGTLGARMQWNSALLGPLFLASGVSTGAAALLLAGPSEACQRWLVRWDIVAIAVELALLALLLLGYATGGAGGDLAAANLLGGAYTPYFWSLVVVLGLAVPFALNVLELRRHLPLTRFAPALILVGGLALRGVLVFAGQDTSYALLP